MEILIIKLGAKGDVLRTLPLALALKKKFPESKISWITRKSNGEFVENSKYVDTVLYLPYESNFEYDALYNFDTDIEAFSLASKISASKKFGFYYNSGFPAAFNIGAEYYLNTLFDDETKKNNKKTYQEMMFMAAELPYNQEHHPISLSKKEKEYSREFAKHNKINAKRLIGINIGSSPRWPSKFWKEEKIEDFVIRASAAGYEVLVLSGPDDIKKLQKITSDLETKNVKYYTNNPQNTGLEFAALVDLCECIVCGDSFALHVSLALSKKSIALFFCTSSSEVEGYGLLKKIISPLLYEFFPEKQDIYSEELVNSISAEEVLKAVRYII